MPASFARPGQLVQPSDESRVASRGPAVDWRRVTVTPPWRRPEANDAPTDPSGGIGVASTARFGPVAPTRAPGNGAAGTPRAGVTSPAGTPRFGVVGPAGPPRPGGLGSVTTDPSGALGLVATDPSGMIDPVTTDPSGGISVVTRFRSPVGQAVSGQTAEPRPAPGRLVAVCLWATVVSLVGVVLAIRSCVEVFVGAPGWFLPVSGLVGLLGVGCTVGALCVARTRMVPWILLGAASGALCLATYLVALADAARAATGS